MCKYMYMYMYVYICLILYIMYNNVYKLCIHVYVQVYLTLFLNIILVFWTTSRCCYNNRYNQSNKLHTIITSLLLFSTSLDQCDP